MNGLLKISGKLNIKSSDNERKVYTVLKADREQVRRLYRRQSIVWVYVQTRQRRVRAFVRELFGLGLFERVPVLLPTYFYPTKLAVRARLGSKWLPAALMCN